MPPYELNPHEASPLPQAADAVPVEEADVAQILRALALAWTPRQRNWLIALMREMAARTASGMPFGQLQVDACLLALLRREQVMRSEAGWQIPVRDKVTRYREAIAGEDFPRWRDALMSSEGMRQDRSVVHFQRENQAITLARLIVYGGGTVEQWRTLETGFLASEGSPAVLGQVLLSGFDAELFDHTDRRLAAALLSLALDRSLRELDPDVLPALAYARRWIEEDRWGAPTRLRARVIEWLLFSAQADAAERMLGPLVGAAGLVSGEGLALQAAIAATRGAWEKAITDFDVALAQLKDEASVRRGAGPENVSWLYPMSLFATRDIGRIALARRFALQESGSRQPPPDSPWGLWVAAADMRLGDRPRDTNFASFNGWYAAHPQLSLVSRRILQAWAAAGHARLTNPGSSQALRTRLQQCELWWLADQVEAADQLLAGRTPSQSFFAAGGQDAWREALAAIAALGAERVEGQVAGTPATTRTLWVISADRHDRLTDIAPWEQKRGPRGWGRPRAIPLTRLARAGALDPFDARLARTIKPDRRFGTQRTMIDLVEAAPALVGHPGVVFDDDLDQPIELVESPPGLQLVAEGGGWRLRFDPDLRLAFDREALERGSPGEAATGDAAHRAVDGALRTQFVVREPLLGAGPRRARLIRLTPAHRRVFELVQAGLTIPKDATQELQSVLPVLGAHFRLDASDQPGATRVEPIEALRVEMSRRGERLGLRLVAAPLGPEGPRFAPGQGRTEIMAMIDGQFRVTQRDFGRERDALDALIHSFEVLDEHGDEGPADWSGGAHQAPEWTLASPQAALDLLEALPTHPSVAGIDWPEGRPIRVLAPMGDSPFSVRVRAEGHWFHVDGHLAVDERQVLELAALVNWAGRHRSRYVPIGEDAYVALTDALRQKLDEWAAVAQPQRAGVGITVGSGEETLQLVAPPDPQAPSAAPTTTRSRGRRRAGEAAVEPPAGGFKVPEVAALWLESSLVDVAHVADPAFVARIERLRAQESEPIAVPATLEAELRPYQREGFEWIARRAAAGVGACLADDMGLGKTVQSLAVLLQRAADGPALVVAPTSVCANWVIETLRFAPTLKARWVRGGDLAELDGLGPRDVIVVSYTILQQYERHFVDQVWTTLVLDEAQAVKNTRTKRTRTVAALTAGFRLALSGTPIENRLDELWSMMNIINPGLLGSHQRFNERFVLPIERQHDDQARRVLRRLIGPFVLRRIKAEVLDDLPPRTEVTLSVEPGPEEAAYHEVLRREALVAAKAGQAQPGDASARLHVLAQLTRLRRAACDPRLSDPELALSGAKIPAIVELVRELVANRHRALVFSQFVDFLALIRKALDAAGLSHQYLDGSTPAVERQRRVDAFQAGEGDLFLISLKAGGFGLNLTAADYVVIVDPWWNPAAEDQATGRAHRMGQQRPVTVYRLVTRGTIEQRIVDLHHDKRALADGILADIDSSAAPSIVDMIDLIGDEES